MLLDLLKPFLRFGAHAPHPFSRSILEFGMVFVLPCSICSAQRISLLSTLDFVASYFGQERTATALADQFVDISHHINRQNDVGSLA